MIDRLLRLFCFHRHLTWPQGSMPYVVCLDCGRKFHYLLHEMKIGSEVKQS
jgi:hypothetical protein